MFGGGTNDAAVQPTDNGQPAVHGTDSNSNGMSLPDTGAALPGYDANGFPAAPADSSTPAPAVDQPTAQPAAQPAADEPADTSTTVVSPSAPPLPDDLLDIKQQALQQLTPLVGHLDQTPEEKFRTTMMMIQAADNADLVKEAYAAAQQITDEKARAQALLDIVNEINYFTQHHEGQAAQ